MPRRWRCHTGGYAYHALNRGVGRATIFFQGRRLRRLREDPAPGQGLVLGALFGLLPYAQSLAPCPVAAQRWRSLEIPALADGHAHATLPCPLPHGRQRPAVPGALQVFPDRRGRTFADRTALRRAES